MWGRSKKHETVDPQPGPWDLLIGAQIESYEGPRDMRELRSTIIDRFLSSKTFSAGIDVGPRIGAKKVKFLKKSMKVAEEDIIKIAIDGTVFGSGKNGFVISTDGIYWKEFLGNPQFTNWQALSRAYSNQRIKFGNDRMVIDNAVIRMTFGFYASKDIECIIVGVLSNFHSAFQGED